MRILAALLLFSTLVVAQPSDDRRCSVDGVVVSSVTGVPIQRAYVSVVTADDTAVAQSDAEGKWAAPHVTCGGLTLSVSRVGFLRATQNGSGARSLMLVANSPVHDVKLELVPQAVLSGRVVDDQGDPVPGAMVSLMSSRILAGRRALAAAASTTTNDLGEYRFAGLVAGKYLVCAAASRSGPIDEPSGSRPYAEKCYPGPLDANPAITMDVGAGYEGREDFTLMPLPMVQVRGVVSGLPDDVNGTVTMISRALPNMSGRMGMGLVAALRKDGTFTVKNVPPGSYTVTATSLQMNKRLMARVPVDVGSNDVEGIQLHVEPGVTVSGAVKVVSVSGKKYDRPQLNVLLRTTETGGAQIVWDESRIAFTMPDVMPGSYRLEVSAPSPLYLKGATMAGRDILNSDIAVGPGAGNIEITVSDDGGVLEGDVSAEDAPATAWVLLQGGASSQPRNVRTDAKGHFLIDTLPPGDYQVYAWDDSSKVEYANPDWMQRNAKGLSVNVQPGQTQLLRLTRQNAPAP